MIVIRRYNLYFAWVIALISVFVSLYSSEILHMPVCNLCWLQRVCIYPLALILGMAAYIEDYNIKKYAITLAAFGLVFALYQYATQMLPNYAPINLCGLGFNCSFVHFKIWGFITYPFLSMIACVCIIVLLTISNQPSIIKHKE